MSGIESRPGRSDAVSSLHSYNDETQQRLQALKNSQGIYSVEHGTAGEPMRALFSELKTILVSVPLQTRQDHDTDYNPEAIHAFRDNGTNYWHLERQINFGEAKSRAVSVLLADGDTPEQAERAIIGIAETKFFLELSERGGKLKSPSMDAEDDAQIRDVIFYHDVVERYKHPEGLTAEREKLLDLLYTTPIHAPAQVGYRKEGVLYRKDITTDRAIAVCKEGEGFFFVLHDKNPYAPLAPVKINLRDLTPEILGQIGVVFNEMLEGIDRPDFVTGIPNAGTPLAQALTDKSGLRNIDMFAKVEKNGIRKIVSRDSHADYSGNSVLIADDVLTEADTKLMALAVALELGVEKSMLFVIVDRQEGGAQRLNTAGAEFHSAMTLDQALKFGMRLGYTKPSDYTKSSKYSTAVRNG